jgi:AraC family 4-hydroxyphenylacetate 3-monooxygenase operon regulatory protein
MQALARGQYPGRRIKENALLGLKAVGYWDAKFDQNWGLPWHFNEGIEISYLESGTMDFAVDGREFTLEPGDLIVTGPWQMHRLGRPYLRPNKLHWVILDVGVRQHDQSWKWPRWLILDPDEAAELEQKLCLNEKPVWRSSYEIRHCFHLIAQAVENDVDGSHTSRLGVRINELILLILDLLRSQPAPIEYLTSSRQSVRAFLSSLASQPDRLSLEWTLENMAAQCGLRVTQFVHYVKELTNMAPLHYLNHCRLEYAAKLLYERPALPVTEIAFLCGFSSSQYFATLFKRRYGKSPRDFRLARCY